MHDPAPSPTKAKPARKPRIGLYDIECNNLKADFGWVLCMSHMELNDRWPKTIALYDFKTWKTDPTNDRQLIAKCVEALSQYDVLIGHYATKFDKRFINTRALKWNLAPLPPIPHVDTWRVAKDNLALSSNRLKSLERYFEFDLTDENGNPGTFCELCGTMHAVHKTELSADAWRRAPTGHRPSMRYVVDHCEADVIQLKKVYLKLRSLTTSHPNVSLITQLDGCPICGVVGMLVKDGTRIARTGIAQRYFCKACKGYPHTKYQKPVGADGVSFPVVLR